MAEHAGKPTTRRRFAAVGVLIALMAALQLSWASPAGAATRVFSFVGSGWGHGVGMSQYGAYGMATRGLSAADIIARYYQGTTLGTPPTFRPRIWLSEPAGASGVEITAAGTVPISFVGPNGVEATAQPAERITLKLVGGVFQYTSGGNSRLLRAAVTQLNVALGGSPVSVSPPGNRYRFGTLELIKAADSIRVVVSDLSMEEYLAGLGEVPSAWPAEALRAQAIAARSYALDRINRLGLNRPSCSCSLFSTTADQVYVGYEKEAAPNGARWVAAVNDTAGVVPLYNGQAVQAFYSSSNGGYTEASEYGFATALPYLRAVPDPDDGNPANPNRRWAQDYTTDELTRWLGAASDTAVGTVLRIDVLAPLTPGQRVGRVLSESEGGVRIVGTGGAKRVSGQRLQSVINSGVYRDGFGYARELRSNRFRVGGFPAYDDRFRGGVYVAGASFPGVDDLIVTGAGSGGGPHVRLVDTGGAEVAAWFAYPESFAGGVRVAACDVDGDGRDEIVTGPGPGGVPEVRVFNSAGVFLAAFLAYDARFLGGVYVACGDLDGDGKADIVTGPDAGGGPHVRAWSIAGELRSLASFFAYDPRFAGGVRVAVANGRIVTGAGRGGGPHVAVFRTDASVQAAWFAFAPSFTAGVYVGAGDLLGDAAEEIVVGTGESGEPQVSVFRADGVVQSSQAAFATEAGLGARVSTVKGSGSRNILVGSGPGGRPLVALDTP